MSTRPSDSKAGTCLTQPARPARQPAWSLGDRRALGDPGTLHPFDVTPPAQSASWETDPNTHTPLPNRGIHAHETADARLFFLCFPSFPLCFAYPPLAMAPTSCQQRLGTTGAKIGAVRRAGKRVVD